MVLCHLRICGPAATHSSAIEHFIFTHVLSQELDGLGPALAQLPDRHWLLASAKRAKQINPIAALVRVVVTQCYKVGGF